jgi:catechol 2,3-dioxygenase-like lactoylglutathione lyase family enzyme
MSVERHTLHSGTKSVSDKLERMELRYHHVSRSTSDLSRILEFYQALGCSLQKHVKDDVQKLERAVLSLPGSDAFLQFIMRSDGVVTPPGLDWTDHLAFHTSNFETDLEDMLTAGGKLEKPAYRTPSGSLVAFVFDPDGHRIELVAK